MEQYRYAWIEVHLWNSVVFKPLRDIYFCGFGAFANCYNNDIKVKIQWNIGND